MLRIMLTTFQSHWGVEQWVVFLKDKDIPVLPRTPVALKALVEAQENEVAPRDLADLVFDDAYLALKLLRKAEGRRSRTLGQETTTALASVLQLGADDLARTVRNAPLTDESNPHLIDCELRAAMASSIARSWASARADVSSEEVALAALLAETGELLLWHFAPELPERALEELHSGRAQRTLQAQQQAVGFSFKQMTLALAEAWQLPPLITQLIKGSDTVRANIARLATNAARHIVADPENPALPDDIIDIKAILPGVSNSHLVGVLPISPEHKEVVLAAFDAHDNQDQSASQS
jgi:HD-like signal output (HDOD) protein